MKKMIAFCGIPCHECGALEATKNNLDQKRAEVAQLWSKQFNADIKPEDINCDGCLSDGKQIFSYCNVCELRKCGKEKGVANCAHCDEYACSKLEDFFQMVPESKKTLDEIRDS